MANSVPTDLRSATKHPQPTEIKEENIYKQINKGGIQVVINPDPQVEAKQVSATAVAAEQHQSPLVFTQPDNWKTQENFGFRKLNNHQFDTEKSAVAMVIPKKYSCCANATDETLQPSKNCAISAS